jgi:hypothetical protein
LEREDKTCKFWLEPLELARRHGFSARELSLIRRLIGTHLTAILEAGMSPEASVGNDPRIQKVRVTKDQIIADLVDGRVIGVPLAWSWRLSEATPAQRAKFRLIGAGQEVHWRDVDEDISVEGLLHGTPARRPRPRAAMGKVRTQAPRSEALQRTGRQRRPLNAGR